MRIPLCLTAPLVMTTSQAIAEPPVHVREVFWGCPVIGPVCAPTGTHGADALAGTDVL
jgi:hypothetical protein